MIEETIVRERAKTEAITFANEYFTAPTSGDLLVIENAILKGVAIAYEVALELTKPQPDLLEFQYSAPRTGFTTILDPL